MMATMIEALMSGLPLSLCQNKKYTLERGSGKFIIPFFWLFFHIFKFNRNNMGIFILKGHTYPAFTKWFFFTALCGKETLHWTYSHIPL
jgi:hypothetical protein